MNSEECFGACDSSSRFIWQQWRKRRSTYTMGREVKDHSLSPLSPSSAIKRLLIPRRQQSKSSTGTARRIDPVKCKVIHRLARWCGMYQRSTARKRKGKWCACYFWKPQVFSAFFYRLERGCWTVSYRCRWVLYWAELATEKLSLCNLGLNFIASYLPSRVENGWSSVNGDCCVGRNSGRSCLFLSYSRLRPYYTVSLRIATSADYGNIDSNKPFPKQWLIKDAFELTQIEWKFHLWKRKIVTFHQPMKGRRLAAANVRWLIYWYYLDVLIMKKENKNKHKMNELLLSAQVRIRNGFLSCVLLPSPCTRLLIPRILF